MQLEDTLLSVVGDARIIVSVVFIVLISAARWLLVRMIRHGVEILSEGQRRWISLIKNGSVATILVGLAFIWLPEIETIALSVTAVAVALVIATKELLLCFSGTVYRAIANPFQIGDWVEIGPHFGEVVDHDLTTTTLQQVDAHDYVFSGRSVEVPNSFLLTQAVVNHSFLKRYVFHTVRLVIEPHANPFEAIESLRTVIEAESEEFTDVARRYNALVEKRSGLDIPGHEPRFHVSTTDFGHPVLEVIVFCPTERAAAVQQAVTRAFFDWYFASRSAPAVAGAG